MFLLTCKNELFQVERTPPPTPTSTPTPTPPPTRGNPMKFSNPVAGLTRTNQVNFIFYLKEKNFHGIYFTAEQQEF